MTSVPAAPVLTALERQGRLFSSLKALANVDVVKRGRKRSFDTVGIVVDDRRRFRIEAFGPLGQTLALLVWDSRELMVRLPDRDGIVRHGPGGLEQLLGKGLEPSELCAVLAGTIPVAALSAPAELRCAGSGDCVLELRSDDTLRKVGLSSSSGQAGIEPRIRSYELLRSGKPVFQARFDRFAEIAHYLLPLSIIVENQEQKTQLTVQYAEADVNVPISDDAFSLTDE